MLELDPHVDEETSYSDTIGMGESVPVRQNTCLEFTSPCLKKKYAHETFGPDLATDGLFTNARYVGKLLPLFGSVGDNFAIFSSARRSLMR